jgi:hypothetical protein
MSNEPPEEVAVRIGIALTDEAASDYGSGYADKEYPEIVWSIYGLPDTNEIVVVAEVGSLKLGMAQVSGLLWPAMVDRTYGLDVDDRRLAHWLSNELWDAHSKRLVAEALRLRSAS